MPRVVVGLSGGVDSSLVAALLKERGDEVVGVYLKIEASGVSNQPSASCPWRDDIEMCRRVAAHLDIPLRIVDASAEYHTSVVQPFIESYARGETPNPDILCNRWVKFDLLIREARAIGADKIATGHYARQKGQALLRKGPGPFARIELLRGIDPVKDQSYFLWMLTQEQLAMTEFPLGEWKKDDVRQEAQRRGLPNWDRRSSRGVCFLGPFDIPAFIRAHTTPVTADVVTTMGERIGTTPDAQTLTIGQRISLGGQPTPRYVVAKDLVRKIITVSDQLNDPARAVSSFETSEPHWIGEPPELPISCDIRIRHRQEVVPCTVSTAASFRPNEVSGEISERSNRGLSVPEAHPPLAETLPHSFARDDEILDIRIVLRAPLTGIAPGQAAVFSIGDRVLGGAWIR